MCRNFFGVLLVYLCSPFGLLSISADQFLKVWDTGTGELIWSYWVGAPALTGAWHPNGRNIAVGDFDGDSKPDVAVCNLTDSVDVLHNDGQDTLSLLTTIRGLPSWPIAMRPDFQAKNATGSKTS